MTLIGGFTAIRIGGSPSLNKIEGDFYNVECRPPFHIIKGKIGIKSNYRVYFNSIKVRLQAYLKSMSTTGANNSYTTVDTSQDIFNSNPIEVVLVKSGGVLTPGRQLLMNFVIDIPRDRVFPTPFTTSSGSLTYKLVVPLHQNGYLQMVAQKMVKFKGYHNLIGTELAPFADQKFVDDEKITSVFMVPNTKVIMGCNERLEATLKLNGKIDNRANATLTFIRNINYKKTEETKKIWSNVVKQTNQATDVVFKWYFLVPSMSRASYVHPLYSVKYFLKYEVTLMPIDRKLNNSVIVEGLAEIQVGTARLSSFRPFADGLLNMASGIQPSAPDAEKDIQASAPYEDIDNSESAMSLVSMLSLPPAYCDLRSRSESSFSLETQPPCYEDV